MNATNIIERVVIKLILLFKLSTQGRYLFFPDENESKFENKYFK